MVIITNKFSIPSDKYNGKLNQEQPERNGHFHRLYIKGQGHRKWPKTLFGMESMEKYFKTHIEVLKWSISKSTYKQLQL